MSRLRFNFLGGKIDDSPLTSIATTITSTSFAALPAVASPDYMCLTLDPDGMYGAPEIVYVTTHTSSATTVTVTRAQENTVARAHPNDTFWVHGITALDFTPTGSLLAVKTYVTGSDDLATIITSSTTLVDADATNLAITFTAPTTGNVLVRFTGGAHNTSPNISYWGVRESTTIIAPKNRVHSDSGLNNNSTCAFYITGITPGDHTYKWAFATDGGTARLITGPTYGSLLMEVWSAP